MYAVSILCLLIRANCAVYDRAEIWIYRGAGYRMPYFRSFAYFSATHAHLIYFDFVILLPGKKKNTFLSMPKCTSILRLAKTSRTKLY